MTFPYWPDNRQETPMSVQSKALGRYWGSLNDSQANMEVAALICMLEITLSFF